LNAGDNWRRPLCPQKLKKNADADSSGKGGTGKTTVAVSLFHYWEKYQNKKVHLVDCDVEEPNDALFLSSAENTGAQKHSPVYSGD
jgi:MinD superfamily P-loop ATPase